MLSRAFWRNRSRVIDDTADEPLPPPLTACAEMVKVFTNRELIKTIFSIFQKKILKNVLGENQRTFILFFQ